LFCKIYDERLNRAEPYFQVLPDKTNFQIRMNIQKNLWEPVLIELEETAGIFKKNQKIELDPDSVRFVVGELEQLSLLNTDHDVIGAAFEVFAERYFVGEKGEFFTPRIAIKNAIEMLDPQYTNTIIDPACGSGGFLIYALEHIWEAIGTSGLNKEATRRQSPSFIYGIDKEPNLVKVARAYMALIGDGKTNIADTDSLMGFGDWNEKARSMLADDNGNIKEFDFVFTNPPFGADIKVESHSILKHYDLGHKWTKPKNSLRWVKSDQTESTEPQILFLELCVNLLKEGGRLCIVLPEGVFGNAKTGYVRQWLLENTTVLAVWDCPEPLFLPHTDTKTCMLFAEKSKNFNQSIMMSFISECGHDRRGAEIKDVNGELKEDFSKALADWHDRPPENSVDPQAWSGSISAMVQGGNLIDDNLLVPRIYLLQPEIGPATKLLEPVLKVI
jgi:type I restriction enzyme M protein